MKTHQCLTDQELTSFDLGNLSADRHEQVSGHLDECVDCAARFEVLAPQPDDVLDQLRLSLPPEALADDAELSQLAENAIARMDTANLAAGDTSIGMRGSSPDLQTMVSEILKPAESTDELGRLGHYRVTRVLGAGGMGVVFEAEDTLLHRSVALKAMKPSVAANPSAKKRFLREARGMAAIEHDHVITIHQVGEDGDVPFLAMQMLKGESLADRLAREGSLSVNEGLRITREVATGLDAAHRQGLVHRDIKPDNIWLETRAEGQEPRAEGASASDETSPPGSPPPALGQFRVKILDFGLARAVEEESQLTQSGMIVGTPNYLAPEQAAGQTVDARSDLFSLGIVLYQMLSGKRPFQRSTLLATLAAIGADAPPPLDASFEHVAPAIRELIEKLLAKDPEQRYASAAELIRAIDQVLDQSATHPQPATQAVAASSSIPPTRRLRAAILGGMAVLALLAGIIVTIKDKDGNIIARLFGPAGATVEVNQRGDNGGQNGKGSDPIIPPQPVSVADDVERTASISPLAMVQRPPKLTTSDGEEVLSHTLETVPIMGQVTAAVSPDGKRIATFSDDGIVRIWDSYSREVNLILVGHSTGPIRPYRKSVRKSVEIAESVSWNPDNRRLATIDDSGELRIWDAVSGQLLTSYKHEASRIEAFCWSPNGSLIAARFDSQIGRILDSRGKVVAELAHQSSASWNFAWSPDSESLATSQPTPFVYVWDVQTEKGRRIKCPSNTAHRPGGLGWSRDSSRIAVCCEGQVVVCDIESGEVESVLDSSADAVAWSLDGLELFVGVSTGKTPDGSWDSYELVRISSGKETKRMELIGDKGTTSAMLIQPLTDQVHVFVQFNEANRLLNLETGECRDVGGHHGLSRSVMSSSAATAIKWTPIGYDSVYVITDAIENEQARWKSAIPWVGKRRRIASSEKLIVAGIENRDHPEHDAQVFDRSTGREVNRIPMTCTVIDIGPNQTFALTVDESTCHVVSLNDGQQVAEVKPFQESDSIRISCARFSPDGSEIAIAGSGIAIHDSSDGKRNRTCQLADGKQALAVAWSPDGKKLAVATRSPYLVEIYDAQTGELEKQLDGLTTADPVPVPSDIRFQNDTTLVYTTRTGHVGYISVETGKQLRSLQIGRDGHEFLDRAVLTPDGAQLLRVTGDRIQIHSLDDGQLQATILPALYRQDWAVISADGHYTGSPGVEKYLRHVIRTEKGTRILPPFEFRNEFDWKNDPNKVVLSAGH